MKYFYDVIQQLKTVGYEENKDIFGLGYDFRKGELQVNNFAEMSRDAILKSYNSSQKKVIIITHSFGGNMIFNLMKYFGDEFCKKYIGKVITVSAPLTGAPLALRALITGLSEVVQFPEKYLGSIERAMLSVFKLTPNKNWLDSVVFYNNSLYKPTDMIEVLNKVEELKEYGTYVYQKEIIEKEEPTKMPGEVYWTCIYGSKKKTEVFYNYTSNLKKDPIITYGPGDGIVPLQSLNFCRQMQASKEYDLGDYEHTGILKSTAFKDLLLKEIIIDN
ncbi:1-O-acylceramide synthase precursor, putative [Entamoeba invadens IP1]|uniref:1-O-acylceramide synthase, putative n=1 Tax=Entamoeba invadens IP1 TaxID=370355 RepID=A0A0A1U9Z6_ENTIV|nr:1-O-acylceramide synthase precursor, putative [Entamoeba invadens IP1]ELP91857.1 1-O-acylceramide synthase precursor, putative [Entamoeba invadens IP1]|eukprot:XP_004258628.1 1-O-acylceramide synthase precursor, putative [Entamoeba invadens IP1]